MKNECPATRTACPRHAVVVGRRFHFIILLIVTFVVAPGTARGAEPGRWHGLLHWSVAWHAGQRGTEFIHSLPEVSATVDGIYERQLADFSLRLRVDAHGTWGASSFNQELNIARSLSLREAAVIVLNPAGEWVLGRQPFMLPHGPDDFRGFGLIAGNAGIIGDGVSWYRPVGSWEMEAATAWTHVLRDVNTGWLTEGDLWAAVRASREHQAANVYVAYAPTVVLSDSVDSVAWSVPFRLDTQTHRLEGEVGQYYMTGSTLVPTGWHTAFVLRYAPLRSGLLRAVELASVPSAFLPYMANLGDRGGRMRWHPGDRGIALGFNTRWGTWDVAWREFAPPLGSSGDTRHMWELDWSPPSLPQPLSSGGISVQAMKNVWQASVRFGLGYRF